MFAFGHPFASVVAPRLPFSVVFTDWLSMMAALGVASHPAASRTRARRASHNDLAARQTRQLPNSRTQGFLHSFPSAVIPPVAEVPPHRAPRRQIMGQHPPGYAAAQHLQDAVDYLPQVSGPGMAFPGVRWQQRSQFFPLGVGQIAGIRFSTHATSVTSILSSPREQTPHI